MGKAVERQAGHARAVVGLLSAAAVILLILLVAGGPAGAEEDRMVGLAYGAARGQARKGPQPTERTGQGSQPHLPRPRPPTAPPSPRPTYKVRVVEPASQVQRGRDGFDHIVDKRCFFNRTNLIGYGVGCGRDISWDEAMVREFGFEMWLYDPTPKSYPFIRATLKRNKDRMHFKAVGLSDTTGVIPFRKPSNPNHISLRAKEMSSTEPGRNTRLPVTTLRKLMEENNHTHIDILKLDIEDSEIDVLLQMIREDFFPVTQLVVEFHSHWHESWANNLRFSEALAGLKHAGFAKLAENKRNEVTYVKVSDLARCVGEVKVH